DIARQLNDYAKSELVRLIAMQNELHSIEDELAENGIKYMLLKGAVIRNYYPKQSMRQMSDIDIDRKSTRLNSSHVSISYAFSCFLSYRSPLSFPTRRSSDLILRGSSMITQKASLCA